MPLILWPKAVIATLLTFACIAVANAEPNLVNVQLDCAKSKDGKNPPYKDKFNGVADKSSLSILFEEKNSFNGRTIVTSLSGYSTKGKIIIRGKGKNLNKNNDWDYLFSVKSKKSVIDALKDGIEGKEEPNKNWERKCVLKLISKKPISHIRGDLALYSAAKREVESLKEKLASNRKKIVQQNQQIENFESKLKSNEAEVANAKTLLPKLAAVESELASTKNQLEELEVKIASENASSKASDSLVAELQATNTALQSELESLKRQAKVLQDSETKYAAQLDKKDALLDELENEVLALNAKIQEKDQTIDTKDILKFAKTITALETNLESSQRELENQNKINKDQKNKISDLETTISTLGASLEEAKLATNNGLICDQKQADNANTNAVVQYLENKINTLELEVSNCVTTTPETSENSKIEVKSADENDRTSATNSNTQSEQAEDSADSDSLQNLETSGGSIGGTLTVKFAPELYRGGYCIINADVINKTKLNFSTFYMGLTAYDQNDYKIDTGIIYLSSLRPETEKAADYMGFRIDSCDEIAKIKLSWHDNLRTSDDVRLVTDDDALPLLRQLSLATKIDWAPSFELEMTGELQVLNNAKAVSVAPAMQKETSALVGVKTTQPEYRCTYINRRSLAFCSGLMDALLEAGGIPETSEQRQGMLRHLGTLKDIDQACGYTDFYGGGTGSGKFEEEFSMGGLPVSVGILAYKAEPSEENLWKMQNPEFSADCISLIRAHLPDLQG